MAQASLIRTSHRFHPSVCFPYSDPFPKKKTAPKRAVFLHGDLNSWLYFFAFAQRAFCASEILLRAAADIVRFLKGAGDDPPPPAATMVARPGPLRPLPTS